MKSVSGNDGSYSLKVSFELGTDPDINTVNVNNRVQVALAKLPEDVRRQGVTVKKQSSALLGVIALYSPEADTRRTVHLQLCDDQSARPDQEHAGRRRCTAVRSAGLFDAGLGADRPADRPWPDHGRRHQGDPVAECPGSGRPHRCAADLQRPAAAAQHPDQGTPDIGRRVREHRHSDQPRWLGAAPGRRRAVGIGCRQSRPFDQLERRAGGTDRHLPVAGRQRALDARQRQAGACGMRLAISPKTWLGRLPTTRRPSSPPRSTRCRRRWSRRSFWWCSSSTCSSAICARR